MAGTQQLPVKYPIAFAAGDDFTLTLTVTESAAAYVWGTVVATIVGHATVTAFTVSLPADGTAILSLTDTQTMALGAGGYAWHLTATKAGYSQTWIGGTLTVTPPGTPGTSAVSATVTVTTGAATSITVTSTGGQGVPSGGTTGQTLTKLSGTSYDVGWSTGAGSGDMLKSENLSGLANYATARANLGLGNAAVLTVDADLATFVVPASTTISAYGATLTDDVDAATARTTLGLGSAATTASTAYASAAQGSTADTAVQPARSISTTAPLTGGGDLSANRTLAVSSASESAVGVVELATTAEVVTGTDTARAVTPAGVKAVADLKLSLVAAGAAVENLGAVESNVQTVAATGATETLDVSVYGVFDMTMDQACTFTFSNPAPSGKLSSFVLILRGAFTPTLPAAVDWGDATPPTYTTPSMYVFSTVDAGTTWLGAQVGKAFG